jgi:hypothetical protein
MVHRRDWRAAVAASAMAIVAAGMPVGSVVENVRAADTVPLPVARWTFDEGTGTVAHDAAGNADGTLTGGATWLTSGAAMGSGAIALDGVTGAVVVPNAPSLEPVGSLTISMWVRGTNVASGALILAKGSSGATCRASYSIRASGSGALATGITVVGPTGQLQLDGPWWNGAWHRLTMISIATSSGTGGLLVAGDGIGRNSVATMPETPLYGLADSNDLAIGGMPGTTCLTAPRFAGQVDDVRLYDTALSDGQLHLLTTPVVTLTTNQPYVPVGRSAHLSASVLGPATIIEFCEIHGTTRTLVGTTPVASGTVDLPPASSAGVVPYVAVVPETADHASGTSTPLTITYGPVPTTTQAAVASPQGPGAPALSTDNLTLTATVTSAVLPNPYPLIGTVEWTATSGTTVKDLGSIAIGNPMTVPASSLGVGTWSFVATYDGSPDYASSASNAVAQEIVLDTVQATDVGVSLSTFFPVRDGYRDSVVARGTRGETASVAIAVRNAAGTSIRTASITPDLGAYAWTWAGTTTAGKIVPAGKYSVVQTLRDSAGTTRVVRSNVTVSLKRLTWKSFAATKTWNQRAWLGYGGAAAGWAFAVPKADSYGGLTVRMYAAGYSTVFAVRVAACAGSAWELGCYDGTRSINGSSLRWYSTSVAGAAHVSSKHVVRTIAATDDRAVIRKVSLSLRYGVLR